MTRLSRSDLIRIDIALESFIKTIPDNRTKEYIKTRTKAIKMISEIGK